MIKIALVVLNYNDKKTMLDYLKNVQHCPMIQKIIVVDNCSTDNSYEALKEKESEKIIVLKSDKNGGYGYGNNVRIRYANEELHAEYTIISNPDVYFTNEVVEKMLNELENNPEIMTVAPVMANKDGILEASTAWKASDSS